MFRLHPVGFALILIHAQSATAQQPGQKLGVRVEVIPRAVSADSGQKSILERGPNDRVWIDRDGDLVVEGATLPPGEPVTFRVTRQTHVQPVITVKVLPDGSGFEYRYSVANGPTARQWIQMFWLDALGPVGTEAMVPADWHLYRIGREKPPIERVYIGCSVRGCNGSGQLSAGKTAGDFVLRSKWGPGLIRVTAIGHKPTPGEPGYRPEESELMSRAHMSEWLWVEINRHLSTENNSVSAYTIGPKVAPSTPPLNAVRDELVQALRLREFGADRKALLELATVEDPAVIRARIEQLAKKASGLPSEFYQNLLSYLP